MGAIGEWFNFGNAFSSGQPSTEELPVIFSVPIEKRFFVETEVRFIFAKILRDVLERTSGLGEKAPKVLWDSCLQSDTSDGLVTHLARAMSKKADLFLVYKESLGTLRVASSDEAKQIREDYAATGKSSLGVALSFKNLDQIDMISFYSELEFLSVASLYKSSNLSKALQIKIKNLRASVSLGDSAAAVAQAKAIAVSLGAGRDVMVDAEDIITSATPDVSATEKSMTFTDGKRSFYLGMPLSYINGVITGGLGDSGNADARAIERGLKAYYFSVIKPVVELLFNVKTDFKTSEAGQVSVAMEVLKTFELISDTYISAENKLAVVNKLLEVESELPPEAEAPVATTQVPVDAPNVVTPAGTAEGEKVADTAFNGAQVTALVEVVVQVNSGLLSPESAINIIVTSFKLSEAEARKIVGTKVKPPAAAPAVVANA